MPTSIPLTSYEEARLAERSTTILDWLKGPTKEGAKKLRLLAYCDEVAAYHVLKAFKDRDWADKFGTSILYSISNHKYRPYFWRIIGAVLVWMGDLDRVRQTRWIDSAIPINFLGKVASLHKNLTPEESNFLAERLIQYELYNLFGDHGILEGIPYLLKIVTTLPDGSRQTQEEALVNGYKRILVYNLLRLQAIKAAKEKKEEPEPATAA